MSEYQYYEFQAVDRPLTAAEQQELRALSTRARITTTSFVNSYEWGDFKGSPSRLIERMFDLHLYLANWGSRRFFLRLPRKFVDRIWLNGVLSEVDCVETRIVGEHLVVEIARDELDVEDFDEGAGQLAALAPLRAKILAGDLRMFYLLWLTAVEADVFADDTPEPLPGVGPLDGPLEAFAEFFQIDSNLVAAAAERNAHSAGGELQSSDIDAAIRALSEEGRVGLLSRLYTGDPFVGVELRRRVRESVAERKGVEPPKARTVGELRARAAEIAAARKRAAASAARAERERREAEAAEARKKRLAAVAARGELAWREVDNEIERRNAAGYDRAKALLADLGDVASSQGATNEFERRVGVLRQKHARKGQFIDRLRSIDRS
ncbi:hypothetical protein [uncultured Rhodoblastus sp.]|uniref:hypothetical protein n=1 Tax=uncultured Rhodoblastus sp. TaxID=543037 RepID=UPI0025F2062B|nr:hypothetical protein [uncultured Rhodoblastus sp.]